jgi:hypothetical protein
LGHQTQRVGEIKADIALKKKEKESQKPTVTSSIGSGLKKSLFKKEVGHVIEEQVKTDKKVMMKKNFAGMFKKEANKNLIMSNIKALCIKELSNIQHETEANKIEKEQKRVENISYLNKYKST